MENVLVFIMILTVIQLDRWKEQNKMKIDKLSTEDVIKKYLFILIENQRIERSIDRTEKWDKEAFHFNVRIIRIPKGGCDLCEHILENGTNWAQIYPQPNNHSRTHKKERSYEVVYSKRSVHINTQGRPIRPTLEEILKDAIQNSRPFASLISFENWASEYGYDSDSIKALKIFETCRENAMHFQDVLGFSEFNEIVTNWEEK